MTLAEKFEKDWNERFARKVIVDDRSIDRLTGEVFYNACSYKQINEWTQQWIFENGQSEVDEPLKFKTNPCPSCQKPRGKEINGALICPCPHCGCEVPF